MTPPPLQVCIDRNLSMVHLLVKEFNAGWCAFPLLEQEFNVNLFDQLIVQFKIDEIEEIIVNFSFISIII